jgi:hypothetical protein
MKPTTFFYLSFTAKLYVYVLYIYNVYSKASIFTIESKLFHITVMLLIVAETLYTLVSLYDYKHKFKK